MVHFSQKNRNLNQMNFLSWSTIFNSIFDLCRIFGQFLSIICEMLVLMMDKNCPKIRYKLNMELKMVDHLKKFIQLFTKSKQKDVAELSIRSPF